MRARVHRLDMAHPGDVSALDRRIAEGVVKPEEIVAVIGKTEGNGGVNDFTRGYFTLALMNLLARHLGRPADQVVKEIPCILSGGTEGVLTPHYTVFCRSAGPGTAGPARLAIGRAFSPPLPAEAVGRQAQVLMVAEAVRAAMADAGLEDPADVRFVQVKCPCVTVERAQAAARPPRTADPGRSMAYARAAGAFGVALALREIEAERLGDDAMLSDFGLQSPRASISSGIEVDRCEVVVLGNSGAWAGDLAIACRPMADALDFQGVVDALADLGQAPGSARVEAALVKCEPDRRGRIRGGRHTMLDDTDINAQRHIRGAVGGLVAGLLGDTRLFVSGGAEHQGPDGGGLVALIARTAV